MQSIQREFTGQPGFSTALWKRLWKSALANGKKQAGNGFVAFCTFVQQKTLKSGKE
jgi:hypothetical protein